MNKQETDRIDSVVNPLLSAADALLGESSYSAVLYGSAARGDYFPQTSDINLMLVLADASPSVLRQLGPAFRAWREKSPAPPLVISRSEWARATDVFPIEISDMQSAYQPLRGADPLLGARVARSELRRALEAELRGKLLRLRQGYALAADDAKALGALATLTIPTMLVLVRGTLTLLDRAESAAKPAEQSVRDLASRIGAAPEGILAMVARRGEREWPCESSIFEAYLNGVERIAHHVDHLHIGDRE